MVSIGNLFGKVVAYIAPKEQQAPVVAQQTIVATDKVVLGSPELMQGLPTFLSVVKRKINGTLSKTDLELVKIGKQIETGLNLIKENNINAFNKLGLPMKLTADNMEAVAKKLEYIRDFIISYFDNSISNESLAGSILEALYKDDLGDFLPSAVNELSSAAKRTLDEIFNEHRSYFDLLSPENGGKRLSFIIELSKNFDELKGLDPSSQEFKAVLESLQKKIAELGSYPTDLLVVLKEFDENIPPDVINKIGQIIELVSTGFSDITGEVASKAVQAVAKPAASALSELTETVAENAPQTLDDAVEFATREQLLEALGKVDFANLSGKKENEILEMLDRMVSYLRKKYSTKAGVEAFDANINYAKEAIKEGGKREFSGNKSAVEFIEEAFNRIDSSILDDVLKNTKIRGFTIGALGVFAAGVALGVSDEYFINERLFGVDPEKTF